MTAAAICALVLVGSTGAANGAKADQLAVDPSFAAGGVVRELSVAPVAATLEPDGKLLLRGYDPDFNVALIRLNRDGSRDSSFGTGGYVKLALRGNGNIVASSDGRILLGGTTSQAGSTSEVVVRLLADGSRDLTFGANGVAALSGPGGEATFIKLQIQPDGTIVVLDNVSTGGFSPIWTTTLEQVTAAGAPVRTLDLPCLTPTHYRNVDLAMQSDGKPVVEVDDGSTQCVARFTNAGVLDASFGSQGFVQRAIASTFGAGIAIDPRDPLGRIVVWVAGFANAGEMARLLVDGTPDPTFAAATGHRIEFGGTAPPVFACANKIVDAYNLGLGATSELVRVARYNGDGTPDATFASDGSGQVTTPIPEARSARSVLVRDDGRVLVVEQGDVDKPRPTTRIASFVQADCHRPFDLSARPVIEYYNQGFDHYFITRSIDDMVALDSGRFAGWSRTGFTFASSVAPAAAGTPVCRFYLPPEYGDSHFFSASRAECDEVALRFPPFVLETSDAMEMGLPDPTTGTCNEVTATPVYRLWNRRVDTNHRYTTDRFTRDAMAAKGWTSEGYGPDGVAMCAVTQ